jgi:hypothetical protein
MFDVLESFGRSAAHPPGGMAFADAALFCGEGRVGENNKMDDAFESFKRSALYSLVWSCSGSFMLGVMVGLMLAPQ